MKGRVLRLVPIGLVAFGVAMAFAVPDACSRAGGEHYVAQTAACDPRIWLRLLIVGVAAFLAVILWAVDPGD